MSSPDRFFRFRQRENYAICRGAADRAGLEDREDTEADTAGTEEAPEGREDAGAWAGAAGTTTRSMELFSALISPSFLQNMRKGKKMVPTPEKERNGRETRTGRRIK